MYKQKGRATRSSNISYGPSKYTDNPSFLTSFRYVWAFRLVLIRRVNGILRWNRRITVFLNIKFWIANKAYYKISHIIIIIFIRMWNWN